MRKSPDAEFRLQGATGDLVQRQENVAEIRTEDKTHGLTSSYSERRRDLSVCSNLGVDVGGGDGGGEVKRGVCCAYTCI